MTKLAIFSDLHVHPWAEHSTVVDGVPSRLSHCVSVLAKIREYCDERDITDVLFGGDLIHKRGVLYTQTYNLIVEELVRWREAGIDLKANVGNHDMADRAGNVHALQALASAGLLETVQDGWASWSLSQVLISAVAYCPGAEELRRRTDDACVARGSTKGKFTVGLFHHGFRGARVGTSLEYVVREDVDPDAYADRFDVMLSGHYHAHQEIGSRGNAFYVGSPLEFVRGETGPKGFLVLDTVEGEIERVDLDLPRFVKLTGVDIADSAFDVAGHVRGNFVDVVFEELPVPWEKLEALLKKYGALGIRAMPTRSDKTKKAGRMKVDPTMDDRTLLESFLEYSKVEPGERDGLLKVGVDLLQEVEDR